MRRSREMICRIEDSSVCEGCGSVEAVLTLREHSLAVLNERVERFWRGRLIAEVREVEACGEDG